ncbi:MAG: UDP-glucose 4-epimerase GalE [Actinobacteria bacterium]|nr:UDP-glucose 4-epimerase GalE [Actinomycetota bacterium]
MKALVIGGAGYIGSHAVYELIRAGHEVAVLDNLSTGKREMVHRDARFYEGDILNKTDIARAIEGEAALGRPVDVVMHFAAKLIVPESVEQPLEYYHNNVEGVRVMLETMVEHGIGNLVFSSTAAVYGEPEHDECLEDDDLMPINPYGDTKLASEKMIKWVCAAHDMNYCIFRYFNVAGADDSLEIGLEKDQVTWLVPLIMQTVVGERDMFYIFGTDYETPDGTCVRDYVHVSDLARAHVLGAEYILENDTSILCNLGSGSGYSVAEVVTAAKKLADFPVTIAERRAGDPAKLIANSDRAKEILGWMPKRTLDDILRSDLEFRRRRQARKA